MAVGTFTLTKDRSLVTDNLPVFNYEDLTFLSYVQSGPSLVTWFHVVHWSVWTCILVSLISCWGVLWFLNGGLSDGRKFWHSLWTNLVKGLYT